jgi:hypothetical protein
MVILYVTAAVLVASPFLPLLLGPILVKVTHSTSARPDIFSIDERELPPPVAYYFRSIGTSLEALGFDLVSYLRTDRGAKNVTSFMMYLCNRDTMDIATVVTAFSTGPKPLTVSYIEFCRKFDDGSELDTKNSSQPGIFATDPARLVFRFPGTDSPQNLWELHRKLVEKERKYSQPYLPPEGTEIESLRANSANAIETQARMGYFNRDGSSHNYRPTWKGACLMTWKLCWPIKQLRAALNRARNDRLLRELYRGLAEQRL